MYPAGAAGRALEACISRTLAAKDATVAAISKALIPAQIPSQRPDPHSHRHLRLAIWFRDRCWQAQAERGAGSDDGIELHRAIVPLHDLVGLRQPDSAAAFVALGGVVEFEDFFLRFGRNAAALVQHFGENHFLIAPRLQRERPS